MNSINKTISIITVTYNSEKFIRDAIDSVINQTVFDKIEYIIIDGASTDKTIEIVKSYGNKISKFITEADNGIYDAMNKGISLATGEIIGILNSDDFYIDNAVLETVLNTFEKENTDSIYGNLYFIDNLNKNVIVRKWKSSKFIQGRFKKGWHPPHPSFFVKKNVYKKFGIFDTKFDVSADFELMLRFLEKYKVSTFYLDEYIIKMRVGGESTGSLKKIFIGNYNIIKAFKKNNIKISGLYPLYRLIPKLYQYFNIKKNIRI